MAWAMCHTHFGEGADPHLLGGLTSWMDGWMDGWLVGWLVGFIPGSYFVLVPGVGNRAKLSSPS